MNIISDIIIKPLRDSKYVLPYTMHYVQNGQKKTWDLIQVHDAVLIILFNISRKKLLFVKQFRPPVYFGSIEKEDRDKSPIDLKKYPPELGITLEFCAGIVDKNKSLVEIAKEEVLEEVGYDAPLEKFEFVGSCRTGVGTAGSKMTTYYCEVTDEMHVAPGGGNAADDELIEIVEMSVQETKEYVNRKDIQSPPSFLYGVFWFLYNKCSGSKL